MATLGQLYSAKDEAVSVFKGHQVDLDKLYIDEDDNIRPVDMEYARRWANQFVKDGGIKSIGVIEVQHMPDGRYRVVDGQHRVTGARLAREMGVEVRRIQAINFSGTDAQRYALMRKKNSGMQLTAVQDAKACAKMRDGGWTNKEIAEEFDVSISYVAIHLDLWDCSDNLKEMVDEGKMSYATAVEMQREHGINADEEAARLLDVAKEVARESGKEETKAKITKKVKDAAEAKKPKKLFGAKQGLRLAELLEYAIEGERDNYEINLSMHDKLELFDLIQDYQNDLESNA